MLAFISLLYVPGIVFLSVVAPIWIIAHYLTKWRTSKILSVEDEKMLAELWESTPTMENRISSLESILDVEVPDWRNKT